MKTIDDFLSRVDDLVGPESDEDREARHAARAEKKKSLSARNPQAECLYQDGFADGAAEEHARLVPIIDELIAHTKRENRPLMRSHAARINAALGRVSVDSKT